MAEPLRRAQGASDEASRVVRVLVQDHGVQEEDHVSISMRNSPEWIPPRLAHFQIARHVRFADDPLFRTESGKES
jgi:hypothetical protein